MKVKASALKAIRAKSEQWLRRWIADGNQTTRYECPECHSQCETAIPTLALVGEKGCWDSLKSCMACGQISFVETYVDGTVAVRPVPIREEEAVTH